MNYFTYNFWRTENGMIRVSSYFFIFVIIVLHFLYLCLFLGIIENKIYLLDYINVSIQVIISLFLIIRFHPFTKHTFYNEDSIVIFNSALFLLTNLGIFNILHIKDVPIIGPIVTTIRSNNGVTDA